MSLLTLSKYSLYAATLSVLVVLPSTFFPFIGGKYYFFRVAVELALSFFILAWAFTPHGKELADIVRRVMRYPLVIAVSAFVLMYLLATIFAYNSHGAFWSNYERGEGAFHMLHYYMFFLLLVVLFRSWKEWRTLFIISLIAAVLMIAYGLAAARALPNFGMLFIGASSATDTSSLWDRLSGPRFQGSLGNPAYVAPYLMFSIFYAFYLWWRGRTRNNAPRTLGYCALGLFFLLFFFLSQTRGAFFGLCAAVLVFLVHLGFLQARFRAWSIGIIAALFAGSGALIHFRDFHFASGTRLLDALPGGRFFDLPLSDKTLLAFMGGMFVVAALVQFLGHVKYRKHALVGLLVFAGISVATIAISPSLLHFSDKTVNTRLWTWGSALKGFRERPLLGWGPENFSTVFDKYFDARHYTPTANSETWFDRAHSVFFDYLAETGILGVMAYAAIFVVFGWELYRLGRRNPEGKSHEIRLLSLPTSSIQQALLLSLIIGYLVQGIVLFDVLPIYMNLFIVLAFGTSIFSSQQPHGDHLRPHNANQ